MLLSLSLVFALSLPAQAQAQVQVQADPAAVITPFVGEEVATLLHADLTKLDLVATLKRLAGPLAAEKEITQGLDQASSVLESLKKAGAKDLFVLLDPTETLVGPPLFVFTLKPGNDPKPLHALLTGMLPQQGPDQVALEVIGNLVFGGSPAAVTHARAATNPPRADVAAAFALAGTAPARVLLVPSTIQRKALEETFPTLPPQLGGAPITTLTQGMNWGALFLSGDNEPSLKLLIQGKDANAAGALAKLAADLKAIAIDLAKSNREIALLAPILEKITPQVRGDQVVMEMNPRLMGDMLIPPIQAAREAARRSGCVNNLKQMALAMHNFADVAQGRFPAGYTTSKDGKPLLSWRVQILPYIEQSDLYNQFHLDEPWDSEHNKGLIGKMPIIYACPSSKLDSSLGKTSYLAPRGKNTISPGAQGVKLAEITDGTSNTIMVIEAGDDAAVIWTKPDDWEIGETVDFKPLLGHHTAGTNAAFADGSVRFLSETLKATVLKAVLTRNGGEVINNEEF